MTRKGADRVSSIEKLQTTWDMPHTQKDLDKVFLSWHSYISVLCISILSVFYGVSILYAQYFISIDFLNICFLVRCFAADSAGLLGVEVGGTRSSNELDQPCKVGQYCRHKHAEFQLD